MTRRKEARFVALAQETLVLLGGKKGAKISHEITLSFNCSLIIFTQQNVLHLLKIYILYFMKRSVARGVPVRFKYHPEAF